jgi:hypothetical protein
LRIHQRWCPGGGAQSASTRGAASVGVASRAATTNNAAVGQRLSRSDEAPSLSDDHHDYDDDFDDHQQNEEYVIEAAPLIDDDEEDDRKGYFLHGGPRYEEGNPSKFYLDTAQARVKTIMRDPTTAMTGRLNATAGSGGNRGWMATALINAYLVENNLSLAAGTGFLKLFNKLLNLMGIKSPPNCDILAKLPTQSKTLYESMRKRLAGDYTVKEYRMPIKDFLGCGSCIHGDAVGWYIDNPLYLFAEDVLELPVDSFHTKPVVRYRRSDGTEYERGLGGAPGGDHNDDRVFEEFASGDVFVAICKHVAEDYGPEAIPICFGVSTDSTAFGGLRAKHAKPVLFKPLNLKAPAVSSPRWTNVVGFAPEFTVGMASLVRFVRVGSCRFWKQVSLFEDSHRLLSPSPPNSFAVVAAVVTTTVAPGVQCRASR